MDAFDAAGNHSASSAPASVTTPEGGGHAAFVQARATSTGSKVTSTTITLTKPVARGDLLVGWFAQYNSTGQVSVSDSVNGAWHRVSGETFSNGGGDIALYYFADSAAAPSGLKITISSTRATYLEGSASEYSGVAVTSPLDQVRIARGNSRSAVTGPTTAIPAGELVFGAIATGGSPGGDTPGSSQTSKFVLRATTSSGSAADEDILSSVSGTQAAGFTLGAATDWYVVAATFHST